MCYDDYFFQNKLLFFWKINNFKILKIIENLNLLIKDVVIICPPTVTASKRGSKKLGGRGGAYHQALMLDSSSEEENELFSLPPKPLREDSPHDFDVVNPLVDIWVVLQFS